MLSWFQWTVFCCIARDSLKEAFPLAIVTYGVDCAKDSLKQHLSTSEEKEEIIKDVNSIFQQNNNGIVVYWRWKNQLLRQLDGFILKWSQESVQNNRNILNDSFYVEIENLRPHIVNGCLSSIPHRTFMKEEKHVFKDLSNIFRSHCIGVQTACSLIAHIVYVYNCHRLGESKTSADLGPQTAASNSR